MGKCQQFSNGNAGRAFGGVSRNDNAPREAGRWILQYCVWRKAGLHVHAAHATHAATAATTSRVILRQFGDHRIGRQDQAGH